MNNEPVAYVNSMCNDYIDWKIDPMSIDGQSLYTHPANELQPYPTAKQYADALAEIEALKEPKIPLLEQEIRFILGNGQCWNGEDCSMPNLMYIIRAVEAAHGIGVKQDE